MPKKSHRLQTKETQLIAWYKWEFLRRNPEYRKDYEAFLGEFGSWFREHGYWYDQKIQWNPDELRFFTKAIAPKAKIICERWQIREPLPPLCKFKKSGSRFYNRYSEILLPTECSEEEAGHGWEVLDLTLSELIQQAPESTAVYGPKPDYILDLRVDLRQPLDFLLRNSEGRIRSGKWKYNRARPPTKTVVEFRRRLNHYKTYLTVWDLKTAGEKFEVIAVLVFPGRESGLQNAKDSYRRAKELIHGGYKELR
jgi:hypothetical protein